MIADLANEVQQRLVLVNQLEITRNELNNIEATLAELETIDADLQRLSSTIRTTRERLLPEATAGMATQGTRIADDLERSRTGFASTRRQVQELKAVQRRLQELRTIVHQAWHVYAHDQISPSRDTLGLVSNLPEISAQRMEIEQLLAELTSQTQKPPHTTTELMRFDALLQALEGRLHAVSHLDPEVKRFLDKVRSGTATVADLTPSVLRWCQEAQHASTFAITFRRQTHP